MQPCLARQPTCLIVHVGEASIGALHKKVARAVSTYGTLVQVQSPASPELLDDPETASLQVCLWMLSGFSQWFSWPSPSGSSSGSSSTPVTGDAPAAA